MKKFFSSEVIFVIMLIVSLNSILLAQTRLVELETSKLYNELSLVRNSSEYSVINLPISDSEFMDFKVVENNTITGDFKKEFPEIMSFDIVSLKNPKYYGALTINKDHLFASIMSEKGLIGIMPIKNGNQNKYKVYIGNNDPEIGFQPIICSQNKENENSRKRKELKPISSLRESGSNGEFMKTLRLVLVCTGEFYEENGKNNSKVNTLMVSVVNGWNVIFKNDLSIRMIIAQSPYLYRNKNTDPFIPDGSGGDTRTTQAVDVINTKFNKSKYDIGHVMHNHNSNADPSHLWDSGGLAGLGVVCDNGTYFGNNGGPNKAAGWSGSYQNVGNSYIQLSAHEVGHQFDMTHTFNGTGSSCTDNITDYTSYEIGSGTTIMSYNGICESSQNIPGQNELDNYYHSNSIERALTYIYNEVSCASTTDTENNVPIVDAGADYSIPKNTPFMLTGTAIDEDDDFLTYCWEEYDEDGPGNSTQGFIGSRAANSKKAPLFRSYPPTSSPVRYFPNMKYILDGKNRNQKFEALPSVGRNINFRLLVRDNSNKGGGIAWDNVKITVVNTANQFAINSQNSNTTLNADGTSTFNLKWSVANTNEAPINCSEVEIFFSEDGGQSFPFLLKTTANDGEENVIIPNLPTKAGRIMIKAKGNIFFDVNNADITITSSCEAIGTSFIPDVNVIGEDNGEIDEKLNLDLEPVYGKKILSMNGVITSSDPLSNLVYKSNNLCTPSGNVVKYDLFDIFVTKSGSYTFELSGKFGLLMNMYESSYSNVDLCENWLTSSAAKVNGPNVTLFSKITLNLVAGKKYILKVSSFSATTPSLSASYSVVVDKKPTNAELYDNVIPPSDDYQYKFIAIANKTNKIETINSNSDFRYLKGGVYTIKGISVDKEDSDLLNSYIGEKYNDLISVILLNEICANLSSNSISVTVFGTSCPVNNAGLKDLQCNDNFTNMDPSDDFITFALNPLEIPDSLTYTLEVPNGMIIEPALANFSEETLFELKGGNGVDEINIVLNYGEDCSYTFVLDNPGTCSDCSNVNARLNEFHYDNKSQDENEFVEVFIEGTQPDSLEKYIIALYNGSNGKIYAEESLNNMTMTSDSKGSYYVWKPSSIQNGDPDGIALIGECGVMEFLSYEGSFTAIDGYAKDMISTDIEVFEGKNAPLNSSIQLIDNKWVSTFAYNTIGIENDLGPCIITDVDVSEVICDNSSTNSNPTDDVISFKIFPIGNQLIGSYLITSDDAVISPAKGKYGELFTFSTNSGIAGNGDIDITITSENIDSCKFSFSIIDPGSCSEKCEILSSGLTEVTCDNNETPNYAGDDFIKFKLNPTSYNNTSTFNLNYNEGSITPNSGSFGVATEFKLSIGSAGGGDVDIVLADSGDTSCVLDIKIVDPGVCSTSAVEELKDKDRLISIFPNPVAEMLYVKSEINNILRYEIINGLGKVVIKNKFSKNMNIGTLKNAAYFILFYDNNDVLIEAHKFLKY